MSKTLVFKKNLKYLLYLLLLMVMFLVLLIAFILHTETGSRFAIKQAISFTGINLTYDDLAGNMSDGLVIENLKFKDRDIDIVIKNIEYQSDIFWFSRFIELSQASIEGVTVTTQTNTQPSPESQPFKGIELPLTIDIKQLLVKQLTWVSETASNTIDTIELTVLLEPTTAKIDAIKVEASDYGLSTSGSIAYADGLTYVLEADWFAKTANQSVAAKGPIEGDLNRIQLKQEMLVTADQLAGVINIQAEVNDLLNNPKLDALLTAPTLNLQLQQQTFELNDSQVEFKGLLDEYSLSFNAELAQKQLNDVSLPTSQIRLEAIGNSQQLSTQVAQITTPEGDVNLQATVDWQDQLHVSSELMVSDFNPQQFLQDWPGLINGKIVLDLSLNEQGVAINTRDNNLMGQLKGQAFTLTGSANYTTNTLSANQLSIQLGDNLVLINGQLQDQDVALIATVNWVDLSVLDSKLSGQIKGTVDISGNYMNPQINTNFNGESLVFAEHQINTLTVISQGQWNKSLSTDITAENASIAGQDINSIKVQQSGWLNDHEVEVILNNTELSTALTIKGQYDLNATNQQPIWQGQLISHDLIVDTDKKIQLQAPIAIEITEKISIQAGCWQGVEAGTLCIALNDISQTDEKYQGSLTLDAFSLIPLQIFIPDNIEVKGKLQGTADFSYQENDLIVESNLQLLAGELVVKNEQQVVYQSLIENFEINANTSNHKIDMGINAQLSDQSVLDLQATLESVDQQNWQITSTLEGMFFSTELIKGLSEEISELEGQIYINGTIKGPITQPLINLNLSQQAGYLSLTRLGTIIEKLNLSISTEGIKQPTYQIKFSGNNLASIHQGQIESAGVLTFPAENQWQYQGSIDGDDFMVLNLPEAKFNISPKLTIVANQQSTDISGDLSIDSGHVIVKQLPPSSVSNSDDLEIHTTESVNSSVYPFTMNVRANIKEPIKLDVIGLDAGLTGSIQLVKPQGKTLEGNGVLNLTDGSYEIYGQKLSINEGELSFTGPLDNPRLKVKASRKSISGDVLAGVELGGTVNNLQSNLYSEPSLSDIEKLSYIMTGRGIDNSGSLDGESLKQAAIVMGLNQSSPIFNQIQNQFGIDVLTVRESAVAADTVVEAGKKINDKLYVSYNQGLFNRLGFWMLKYRINEFLNLETTQGEDQSVELVYTRKAEVKNNKNKDN